MAFQMGGGGEASYPDPEIRGAVSEKIFFGPFGPQFGLKIRGWHPGNPPESATEDKIFMGISRSTLHCFFLPFPPPSC